MNRRTFVFCSCGAAVAGIARFGAIGAGAQAARRQISIGGKRVRTVDMHAHVFVQEAWPLVKDLPKVDRAMANLGSSTMAIDAGGLDRRFREMDRQGIDVHVISVHPSQFLYFTEPDLVVAVLPETETKSKFPNVVGNTVALLMRDVPEIGPNGSRRS